MHEAVFTSTRRRLLLAGTAALPGLAGARSPQPADAGEASARSKSKRRTGGAFSSAAD
jgi:hypothetical protein